MGHTEYTDRVVARLIQEGAETRLSDYDREVINFGWGYGIGPGDCACQIIANRADCADLDAAIDRDLADGA